MRNLLPHMIGHYVARPRIFVLSPRSRPVMLNQRIRYHTVPKLDGEVLLSTKDASA